MSMDGSKIIIEFSENLKLNIKPMYMSKKRRKVNGND